MGRVQMRNLLLRLVRWFINRMLHEKPKKEDKEVGSGNRGVFPKGVDQPIQERKGKK